MSALGATLSQLGQVGDEWGQARQAAQVYRQRLAAESQRQQLIGEQIKALQQQITQTGKSRYIGQVRMPDNSLVAIVQDPTTGAVSAQKIYGGIDRSQAAASVQSIFNSLTDPEARKEAESIYNGVLQSTGNPQLAIQELSKFASGIVTKDVASRDWMDQVGQRMSIGQQLGLKGDDLLSYALIGPRSATQFSFTPAGKRELRPPAARGSGYSGSEADVKSWAEMVHNGSVSLLHVPAAKGMRTRVNTYLQHHKLSIPKSVKPTTPMQAVTLLYHTRQQAIQLANLNPGMDIQKEVDTLLQQDGLDPARVKALAAQALTSNQPLASPKDFGPTDQPDGTTGTLPDGTKVVARGGRIVAAQ